MSPALDYVLANTAIMKAVLKQNMFCKGKQNENGNRVKIIHFGLNKNEMYRNS